MAIEKNTFKVARFDPEYPSMHSSDTLMSSDDEDFQQRNSISAVESDGDDDDEFDDCDSGAGSDDFDLLELGETSEEFCQVGIQTCSIPYELYDLPGLKDVLSMDVWNEFLTERERFGLARYLPDMDQEDFTCTLKELFAGDNLHFGSPVDKLFEMLKGGLCEPRVALYRQGLNFFQRRQHYHNLKKHQNTIVNNLCQIRDAWLNCRGYSIEEKLRVLNIIKSQKSLMNENMEELGGESSDREESLDDMWGIKVKVPKLCRKVGRYFGYHMGPTSDISSGGRKTTTEPTKRGKQNLRGSLNLAGLQTSPKKELAYPFRPTDQRIKLKSGRYGFGIPLSGYGNAGDKSSAVVNMSEQMMADEEEEATIYEVALHGDQNFPQVVANSKPGASKIWKKHQGLRADKDVDSFKGIPISARNDLRSLGWNKAINQLSDIKVLTAKPSNARDIYDGGKSVKYAENLQQFTAGNQMKLGKAQNSNLTFKGSRVELLDGSDSAWLSKQHGGLFPSNLPSKPSDLNAKNKRWNLGKEAIELQENDKLLHAEYRAKSLKDKFQASSLQNGRRDGVGNQGMRTFSKSEETESGSSEQMNDEDEDDNTLMRSKWAYPGNVQDLKYGPHTKKAKLSLGDKKDSHLTIDGSSQSSRKIEGYSEDLEMMKEEQMGKMNDIGYLNILPSIGLNKNYFPGPDYIIGNDDRQQFYQLGRNGNVEGNHGDSFHIPSMKSSLTDERRLKDEVRCEFDVPQSNYMHDYKFQDDWFWMRQVAADNGIPFKLDKSGQMVELPNPERYDIPLMGCNNLPKKWEMKHDLTCVDLQDNNDHLHADAQLQLGDVSFLRKRGKNKLEDVSDSLEKGMSETPIMEMEMEDVEAEPKPQKKPFPLITPTVLSGFSFSIIHLLSAVRMAMISLLPEDSSEARKHIDKKDAGQGVEEEQDSKQEDTSVVNSSSSMDINTCGPCAQAVVPSLTVQEIVNRVRSNPGDPCIIETQEPLQDLVRGVLKIFSSRSAPLGAKGWKPLVVYEKSSKGWSWIGPVSHNLSDSEAVEEVTSPDSWGLPHKMLVKLVDSYANWLKNSQDALQQIGSLPSPPLTLMQINLDEKERFKDMRAQKSLSTISPSSEEVKAYFHKEEVLRYLISDRAFSYTAVDGKKSIVAPLRRCGGKPTSKARDHFMLKRNRPPHVTILCLVRDAAARLPGSIGTRADVCTLIRDSQYIVEDVSDAQVNQVVSGALDRLHYERDPCVQFDGERKLWVYLHREREEEDFEDDGTSSTKKWRRPKKEATEPSDQVEVTVAYTGPLGQSEFDLVSDLNVDKSCVDNDKRSEPDHHNANGQVDDNAETSHGSDQGVHHGPVWNGLRLNTMKENKLICRENSNSEDFIDETFGEEPPI